MKNIHSKPFFIAEEELVYTVGEGVTRQFIAYDNNIMMVKVMFEKGAIGYQHSHPHVQTSYIVSGQFEVKIGSEVKVLQAGDGFYAEPDILHGCTCLVKRAIIDVFHPVRDAFVVKIEK